MFALEALSFLVCYWWKSGSVRDCGIPTKPPSSMHGLLSSEKSIKVEERNSCSRPLSLCLPLSIFLVNMDVFLSSPSKSALQLARPRAHTHTRTNTHTHTYTDRHPPPTKSAHAPRHTNTPTDRHPPNTYSVCMSVSVCVCVCACMRV